MTHVNQVIASVCNAFELPFAHVFIVLGRILNEFQKVVCN